LTAPSPFAELLIAWQKTAGRHDLPWQKTRDPYRIWLSEIMLQQTQVSTVIPYYQRFLASFPDVRALAAAPVESVMEHWAGLGYYARARNLHRCAQQVVAEHGGVFPASAAQLETLPGIGRSTAAAVAAFAFGARAAILDGNVKRVLCRQFAVTGFPGAAKVHQQLWELAESLLPQADIEAYTQGLMDLGAGTCTRSRPACQRCPVAAGCLARQQDRQAVLPEARPRAAVPERTATFVLIRDGQRLLLERRPPSGLWGGLLVPPEGAVDNVLARLGLQAVSQRPLAPLRHAFTHFRLTLEPVLCEVQAPQLLAEPGLEWVELAQAATAAVPAPIGKLLRQVASAAD
jgi:A/G-specific adenine glycosylase